MCGVAHLAEHLHQRRPHKSISPPRRITSLSGARPDMEHTRLGLDAAGNPVSLHLHERLRQIAVLGKTGMGKSTLLRSIVAQDIARGDGVLLIDPHGTLAEECLALIPPPRRNQVCFFDLVRCRASRSPSIMFADVHADDRELLAEGIVSAMFTIWGDSWGPQLERILRNSLIVLLDSPGTSFLHIPRFLTDPEFRARVVEARQQSGGARRSSRANSQAGRRNSSRPRSRPSSTRSKPSPSIRRSAMCWDRAQQSCISSMRLRHGRIVIAKLAKGAVGDKPAFLMGSLLLARALAAIMARERDPEDRRPFHIVIDEAQNFGPA